MEAAMDMDIDISWCLTCSKRVANPASPYCSFECRQQDGQSSSSPFRLAPIYCDSPLSRTTTATVREGSSAARRKPSAPSGTRPSFSIAEQYHAQIRDRRAFSFPASTAVSSRMDGDVSPPSPLRDALALGSSMQQLRFARRPVTYSAPQVDETTLKVKAPRRSRPSLLSSSMHKSTAPIVTLASAAVESAIYSTSEESEDEPMLMLPSPAKPSRAVDKPISSLAVPVDATNSTATTYASYLPAVRPLPARKPSSFSRSPSAFLAATSASRSREDILSWAKNVGMRPRVHAEESNSSEAEDEHERGRQRSRRRDPLPGSATPSNSSVMGDTEVETAGGAGVATTPKGSSALSTALNGLGFGLGFVPFTSRIKAEPSASVDEEAVTAIHQGGATPTMSTVSFSEVMEPSIGTDLPESIEIANDGDSSSRSGFQRTTTLMPSYLNKPTPAPATTAISTLTQTVAPSPLKPINALWNLSSYLRSFKPFAVAGALVSDKSQRSEEATVLPPAASRRHSSGFVLHSSGVPMPARSPVQEVDEVQDERELVKSLPMDIIPMGSRSLAPQAAPPSEIQTKTRSRSRSANSQALLGRGGKGMGVGRQRDNYSAASSLRDESPLAPFEAEAVAEQEAEKDEDERGRRRRVISGAAATTEKIVPVALTPVSRLADLPGAEAEEEGGRGRGRRRGMDSSVSRGRSGSRGRKARDRGR